MAERLIIYLDGSSRGNPGPAGVGILIFDEHMKLVREIAEFIGETTNNIAEYTGLIYALEEALLLRAETLFIKSDSELVVRQMNGDYRIKSKNIRPLFERCRRLLRGFKKVEIKHIPREDNRRADRLAQQAIGPLTHK